MSWVVGGRRLDTIPIETNNKAVPVNIQDQTTKPLDSYFSQITGTFGLNGDTGVSGLLGPSFIYTFNADPGHGLAPGMEILLFDPPANRAFFAVVTGVAIDIISVDRPIDHLFPEATTVPNIVSTNMNLNGNPAAPEIFSIGAGAIPIDVTRMILSMTDDDIMDSGKFGGIAALPNGLVLRVFNTYQKVVFNFKTNADIKQFCFDGDYDDKAPAGTYGFTARMSFAGPEKHGVALRIQNTDVIQWIVQDDLRGLTSLRIAAEGHEVAN